jgi:hypothetical protein
VVGRNPCPELETAVRTLLTRFVTVSGKPVERPSLIATRDGPVVDGLLPQHPEALELAVSFGALTCNPRHPVADEYDAWKVVTADNCDLWIQPIDVQQSRIALERGLRVRTLAGGYRFSDDGFRVPPPLELHSDGGGSFDEEVADAVYRLISAPDTTAEPDLARRLRQAIRWWVKSWRNSTSLSWEDRVVHLRTAVDALVGSDATKAAINWLNDLFASAGETESEDLLWASGHGTFERTWGNPPKSAMLPALDHWFWSFADERNEIVHHGGARSLVYEQAGSPYSGMLVDVADRVVADAILVSLGRCGFNHLWKSHLWRAIARALHEHDSSTDASESPTYPAHATPSTSGWRVVAVGVDGAEVVVDHLELAEAALAPEIAARVGADVEPSQVYVIPIIEDTASA